LRTPTVKRIVASILRHPVITDSTVGVELVTGLPERPGSQQRHFLQAPEDVFVCSVLTYVQRIRGFTTMRYINLRFTYLLTYFTSLWEATRLQDEGNPAVEAELGKHDLTYSSGDADVAADAVDGDVSVGVVLEVRAFVVDVDVDARTLRVTVAAAERETVHSRFRRSAADDNNVLSDRGQCAHDTQLIMFVLWNTEDHYIFALWFLLYGRPM